MAWLRGFEPVDPDKRKYYGCEPLCPTRATKGSACYDVFSPVNTTLDVGESQLIWLNVKAYMLPDEVLKVFTRSSMGKVGVTLANDVGIIDCDYYGNEKNDGNIGLMLTNNGDEIYFIDECQAIGQVMFQKILFADNDIVKSEVREGGFGSTDENN